MNLRLLSAALAVCVAVPGFLSTTLSAQWGPMPQAPQAPAAESAATPRRELLERLDRVQSKGPRFELTASLVRTSKAAGKLSTIPFKPGSENLPVAGGQALLNAVEDARVKAVLAHGAIVIVLGYPDAEAAHGGGTPALAARRAAIVEKFLVSAGGVTVTTASFGAAASASGPGGGAEVWVILP
ncbi:MAG: hypothetical protein JSR82_12830 [Verrucomicrobia bacterium]|nr:hypothetical protein [Verrucomicrobiota bacterium]